MSSIIRKKPHFHQSGSLNGETSDWFRPQQWLTAPPVQRSQRCALLRQWPAIRSEDLGVYVCQAENSEGVSEAKIEVIVEEEPGAPVASVTPEEITAVEGQTVSMECRARGTTSTCWRAAHRRSSLPLRFRFLSGSPPPLITWSKLRAPLPWKSKDENGVLTLESVGRQDSGQYICNATNVHGYSEAYAQMEVESESRHRCQADTLPLSPHGRHFSWSSHSPPLRHLPARPGEAAGRRPPAPAVPCSRLPSHPVHLESSGQGGLTGRGTDHQRRKAADTQRQTGP